MDLEQPMYGLTTEIATLDKKQVPPNRVEDLAAFYIKEMRILQPEGPEFTYRKLNTQASQAYVPQVYPGRVTLFRASKHEFELKSSALPHQELPQVGVRTRQWNEVELPINCRIMFL